MLIRPRHGWRADADQVLIPPDMDGVLPAVSRLKLRPGQWVASLAVVQIYHARSKDR